MKPSNEFHYRRHSRTGSAIDDGRDLVPTAVVANPAQRFGMLLNDGRTRVAFLEHTMAEAHDPAFVRQRLPHPSLRPIAALDLDKHLCDGLIRSPMERPLHRADGRSNGRVQIRHGRRGHAGREGGGIEFMLSIKCKRHVEYAGHRSGRVVVSPVGEQEEQIFGEAQISLRSHAAFPVREPMCRRNDERDLRQQSDRFADVRVVGIVGGIRIGHAQQ